MPENDSHPATRPLVLDTDIGSDVDDALALGVLLDSPEVRLTGITTVYGDTLLRARLAHRLAALAGHTPTVVPSTAETLSGKEEAWWPGHEGSAATTCTPSRSATTSTSPTSSPRPSGPRPARST
ncbi:nucleoside hydrolase [Streptomyces sp. ZSW22]|uniref:nucleoside hydrolase n=1 Tax=Streptomyces sp. ZSW22 TaxID=3055050 RepID=UPI0025B27EFD|nr:nucleoside hydrolase [Streptomyces sp. ZSW22]MDN3247562.1 nucleoside hydrolase [Streptomyces sp. ZSW22]